MRRGTVALVAASQLLLRVVRVARLSRVRPVGGLSMGLGHTACAGLHVLDPGLRDRHSAAGGADAALPRRALPRLSVAYESILSAATASMIPGSGAGSRKRIMPGQKGVAT